MANLGKVVYLSDAQYATLIANGSVTVGEQTVTYNANDIYVTPSMPYDNSNKNKLFLNYQIGRFTYSSGGVNYRYPNYCYYSDGGSMAIETRLSLKRSGTEQISKAAYATSHIGLCDVPGGDVLQHIYDIQAGDALTYRIGAIYSGTIDVNTDVSIVVNGEEIYHSGKTEWESGEDLGAIAYTVKEGDMIVINFLNTEIPEAAPTTATLIVNSTAYLGEDNSDPEWVPDYAVDYTDEPNSNSALKVSGYSNIPVHSFSSFSSADAPGRTVYSKTYTVVAQRVLSIDIQDTSGMHPSAVKITVNGNVLYNGVVEHNYGNEQYNTAFSYTFKAGDLVVVDWIRVEDETPVVDNPNRNTLWVQCGMHDISGYSVPDYMQDDDGQVGRQLLSLIRGASTEIISSYISSPWSDSYYGNRDDAVRVMSYTIQAGDTLRIHVASVNSFLAKIKIVVNGTTIYDAERQQLAHGDTDATWFSYTVKDGDEIYVRFEEVTGESTSGTMQILVTGPWENYMPVGANITSIATDWDSQYEGFFALETVPAQSIAIHTNEMLDSTKQYRLLFTVNGNVLYDITGHFYTSGGDYTIAVYNAKPGDYIHINVQEVNS